MFWISLRALHVLFGLNKLKEMHAQWECRVIRLLLCQYPEDIGFVNLSISSTSTSAWVALIVGSKSKYQQTSETS
jgi:hypothetical protein